MQVFYGLVAGVTVVRLGGTAWLHSLCRSNWKPILEWVDPLLNPVALASLPAAVVRPAFKAPAQAPRTSGIENVQALEELMARRQTQTAVPLGREGGRRSSGLLDWLPLPRLFGR